MHRANVIDRITSVNDGLNYVKIFTKKTHYQRLILLPVHGSYVLVKIKEAATDTRD